MIKVITKTLGLTVIALAVSMTNVVDSMADENLPEAEAILKKYVDVLGGAAAFEKVKSKVTETITSIPAKKREIKTTTYMQRPDKVYAASEIVVFGKTWVSESGKNGDVVWESYPRKQRVLSGLEKERRLMDYAFDGVLLDWKKYFKSAKVLGVEDVDGKSCYKVALTPMDGQGEDMLYFFDKDSSLVVKVIRDAIFNDEKTKVQLYLSDYKKVDDVMVPYTTKRTAEGEDDIIITINSIKSNVDIPADKFNLPEKIKKIVEKG